LNRPVKNGFQEMVFLIDILHPAHVHFFKHIRQELTARGHRVIVTTRRKEMSIELLEAYGIPYTLISTQKRGIGLIGEMIVRTLRLMIICIRHRPCLLMGIMGPSIAVAGFVLRIPQWVFYDTENAWITNWFAYPLASRIYSPECYLGKPRRNQIRYAGYHELAYLHPIRFAPDASVAVRRGIDPHSRYSIVRFVSWQASHDISERGLDGNAKQRIVTELQKYGEVYITSEAALPPQLEPKKIRCPPEEVHHILAFASLLVGESATMASEAAVMGVPALFISDTSRGYTLEEEKRYGMVYNFSNAQIADAVDKINEILGESTSKQRFEAGHRKLLSEKHDVTGFIISEISKEFKI
jgi:predicted glycosyltransferase